MPLNCRQQLPVVRIGEHASALNLEVIINAVNAIRMARVFDDEDIVLAGNAGGGVELAVHGVVRLGGDLRSLGLLVQGLNAFQIAKVVNSGVDFFCA